MTPIEYTRTGGSPWVNVTYDEAVAACKNMGGRLPTIEEAVAMRMQEPVDFLNLNEWVQPFMVGEQKFNVRGGSWNVNSRSARSSARSNIEPSVRSLLIGFRCVHPSSLPAIYTVNEETGVSTVNNYYTSYTEACAEMERNSQATAAKTKLTSLKAQLQEIYTKYPELREAA
jgi:hypothetical protein